MTPTIGMESATIGRFPMAENPQPGAKDSVAAYQELIQADSTKHFSTPPPSVSSCFGLQTCPKERHVLTDVNPITG
jgi:hypothetical protein